MLGVLRDPSALGPWIALALLGLLYSVALSELSLAPLLDRLARSSLAPNSGAAESTAAMSKRAVLMDLGVLAVTTGSLFSVAALVGGDAGRFLGPSSLAVLLTFAPLNAAFHGVRGHHRAFMAGYSPLQCTPGERLQHQLALRSARDLIYALGTVGVIIGLIHVLSALDSPDNVGKGLAICLLCPLYAVAVAELFVAPRICRLEAAGLPEDAELRAMVKAAGRNRAPLVGSALTIAGGFLLFVLCVHAI